MSDEIKTWTLEGYLDTDNAPWAIKTKVTGPKINVGEKVKVVSTGDADPRQVKELAYRNIELAKKVEILKAELIEQAKLNGIGSEREAKLATDNKRLTEQLEDSRKQLTWLVIYALDRAIISHAKAAELLNVSLIDLGLFLK